MFLSIDKGGCGLRSVNQEYSFTKIKVAVKLYQSPKSFMRALQIIWRESAWKTGRNSSLVTEVHQFAAELGTHLTLKNSGPSSLRRRRNLISISNVCEQTQRITGSAFQISCHPDWQLDYSCFNRLIVASTQILIHRWGHRTGISKLFRIQT